MKFSGLIVCLLSSGCLFAAAQNPPGGQPQPVPPQPQPVNVPMAFITSERVVYAEGQPIDLTFAVAAPKTGTLVPRFKIEKEDGDVAPPKLVNGNYFWQASATSIHGVARQGAIAAVSLEQEHAGTKRQYVESVADLRAWYEMVEPGFYRVSFDGEWMNEGLSHQVTSNTILVRVGAAAAAGAPNGGQIEPQIIPLADIWALDMPGTQPMDTTMTAGNPPVGNAPEGKLVAEIMRAALTGNANMKAPARPGFAVPGTGMDALLAAHATLVDNHVAPTTFHHGDLVSIVFFSKSFDSYMHLDHIERYGNVIQISYKLIRHNSLENTSHFALIPITLHDIGSIRVEMKPIVPPDLLSQDITSYVNRVFPKSFQFEVVE